MEWQPTDRRKEKEKDARFYAMEKREGKSKQRNKGRGGWDSQGTGLEQGSKVTERLSRGLASPKVKLLSRWWEFYVSPEFAYPAKTHS